MPRPAALSAPVNANVITQMNKTTKRLIVAAVLFVFVFSGYTFSCSRAYIDEVISEGSAYGFKIGETKLEVFKKAKSVYQNTEVYILYPLDKNNFGPHKRIAFQDNELTLLENRKSWDIYYEKGYFNFLKLKFKNGKLATIYRHKKNFELP